MEKVLQIWVDGSCTGNQNQPGKITGPLPKARSAAYFPSLQKGRSCDLPGATQTNIRAELFAVLLAFAELERMGIQAGNLEFFTDCLNVLKWAHKQQKANKNLDLIQNLWHKMDQWPGKITFLHVKGHSGDPNNEMADKLATGKVPDFG